MLSPPKNWMLTVADTCNFPLRAFFPLKFVRVLGEECEAGVLLFRLRCVGEEALVARERGVSPGCRFTLLKRIAGLTGPQLEENTPRFSNCFPA